MISYRIGFSECEHRRASNGQHARKPLFTESWTACQGQNSGRGGGTEKDPELSGFAASAATSAETGDELSHKLGDQLSLTP